LLQGFLNFLGYFHLFLASYQLEEEVLERGVVQQGSRLPKDDAKTIRSFIALLTGKINKLL